MSCVDKSSTRKYNGAGVIFKGPGGEECEVAIQLKFTTTNNEAEYKAIIAGINMAQEIGVKNLEVRSDSQVVVGQIKGEYESRGDKMKRYLEKVKKIMGSFDKIAFTKVPREENSQVDTLAHISSATKEEITTTGCPAQEITKPLIVQVDQVACIEEGQGCPEWVRDIM